MEILAVLFVTLLILIGVLFFYPKKKQHLYEPVDNFSRNLVAQFNYIVTLIDECTIEDKEDLEKQIHQFWLTFIVHPDINYYDNSLRNCLIEKIDSF